MPLKILMAYSMCKLIGGVPARTWRALVDTVLYALVTACSTLHWADSIFFLKTVFVADGYHIFAP